MNSNIVKDNLESIFSELEKFIKTKTVVGEPMQVGEASIIPLISVSFGAGCGGGNGTDDKGSSGVGAGGGGAAKIEPTAVLVIKNGEVSAIPIGKKSSLEKLVNMVPEIVSKLDLEKKDNESDISE